MLRSEKVSSSERTAVSLVSVCDCLACEGGPLLYDGVQLVQNSASLNGTQRVLLDQVITEEECSALKHLAHVRTPQASVSFWILFYFFSISSFLACQAVTIAGDGYRGRMSPHTPNEKFEGASVLKTLQVQSSPTNLKTTQRHSFTA